MPGLELELRELGAALAEGLSAIHACGVVHRDLKPGNVMIADGEPVVIDFGIAQLVETTRLTLTGMFMGTPGYLAPEVIEGKETDSLRSVRPQHGRVGKSSSAIFQYARLGAL